MSVRRNLENFGHPWAEGLRHVRWSYAVRIEREGFYRSFFIFYPLGINGLFERSLREIMFYGLHKRKGDLNVAPWTRELMRLSG